MLWQDLVPGDLTGDQLTGPQLLHWSKVSHPRDGAAEKDFLACLQFGGGIISYSVMNF